MNFVKTESSPIIDDFRKALYQRFSTALDGMWEALYIASSQAYLIQEDRRNIGYCCIDEQGSLTQIYLSDEYNYLMDQVIRSLIASLMVSSAKLSSIEPISFNACLANATSTQINSFCFQHATRQLAKLPPIDMQLVSAEEAPEIRAFFKKQMGFDDNFGYADNLINRKELFVHRDADAIVVTGECRRSDSQPEFADIGMVVNSDYRRQGIGSRVLHELAQKAQLVKRQPICSTTYDNIASRKAIEKAGFYCSHIIFDIQFAE